MTQPTLSEEPVSEVIDNSDLDDYITETEARSDETTEAALSPTGDEEDAESPDGSLDTDEAPVAQAPETEVVAPVTDVSTDTTRLQQEIDELKANNLRRDAQENEAQTADTVRRATSARAAQLQETEYLAPEQAQRVAQAEIKAALAEFRQQQAERKSEGQLKKALADELSLATGAPVELPMLHDTETGMRSAATLMGPTYKANQLLLKNRGNEKKATIPAQEFDRPAASRAGAATESQLLDRYNANPNSTDPTVQAAGRRAALGR